MSITLRGIIPPIVTPFDQNEDVDHPTLAHEIEHYLALGVAGVTIGGSTGEGHVLGREELHDMIVTAKGVVSGSVPVVAGVIQDSTRGVIDYGLRAKEAGADALQVTPVHYVFPSTQDDVYRFYKDIAEATDMPIVIYNVIPWSPIEPETVARLFADVDLIVGVKQSGRDSHRMTDLLALAPAGGSVLCAIDDMLYPFFAMGADGTMGAAATAAPGACVDLWNAVQTGDHERALVLHHKILRIWRALESVNIPARMKALTRLQGRDTGVARRPMAAADAATEAALRAALEAADLLAV